jgi:hypothetical protein
MSYDTMTIFQGPLGVNGPAQSQIGFLLPELEGRAMV